MLRAARRLLKGFAMTRADFEREVAGATGETVGTIRDRGFSLVIVPDREPLTVDWDAVQQVDPIRMRPQGSRRLKMAA